jgi:hypothetical protein
MPAQVYLDCFDQMPVRCDNKTSPPNCTAIRNTKGNQASIVTEATVTNYIAGKKRGLSAATKLVEAQSGGIFTAKTWDTTASHDPYGTASDKPHTRTHFSAFSKRRRLMSRIPPPSIWLRQAQDKQEEVEREWGPGVVLSVVRTYITLHT